MSYQTGSASSAANLMDTLLTFAQAEGWSDVSGDWPISKGNCHVHWSEVQQNFIDWDTGGGGNLLKDTIRMAIGTSLPGSVPSPWYDMPGTIVSSDTDGDAPFFFTNGTNSILAYHFFTVPAVADYIHVVIQIAAELYQHFSFGNIDKRGLTHSGVGYVTAQAMTPFSDRSGSGGRHHNLYDTYRGFTGHVGEASDATKFLSIHPIDVLPVGYIGNNTILPSGRLFDTIGLRHGTQFVHNNDGIFPQNHTPWSLADQSKPLPVSGDVPLYSMPIIIHQTTAQSLDNRCVYTGEFPGIRYCRMDGMQPGDEFTFGGDTWKVFPVLRLTEISNYNQPLVKSSGPMSFAYQKVV